MEFHQPMMSVKNEVRRSVVISELQAKIPQLTAERLYHYFQSNPPEPDWHELFYADDHEIWYNQQQRQSLQQQARQNGASDQQGGQTGNDSGNSEKQENNSPGTDVTEKPEQMTNSSSISEEWKDISWQDILRHPGRFLEELYRF